MVDGIEADAKKTLTGPAGHSPLPVNLYCATSPPPEVGQLDRGGDELTKAGNARGITGEPPPTFQMMPAMLMPAYFLHQQPFCPLLLPDG